MDSMVGDVRLACQDGFDYMERRIPNYWMFEMIINADVMCSEIEAICPLVMSKK